MSTDQFLSKGKASQTSWSGDRQSPVMWCTITPTICVTQAKTEWPSQIFPPIFAACVVWRFKVHYISLNNVLQVFIYLYTIWMLKSGDITKSWGYIWIWGWMVVAWTARYGTRLNLFDIVTYKYVDHSTTARWVCEQLFMVSSIL